MYISAEPTLVCKVLSPRVFYRTGVPTRTGESESESGVSFLDPSGRKAEKNVRNVFHAARCRTHAGTRKGLIQNVNTIEDAGWWSYAFKQGASGATSHPASSACSPKPEPDLALPPSEQPPGPAFVSPWKALFTHAAASSFATSFLLGTYGLGLF